MSEPENQIPTCCGGQPVPASSSSCCDAGHAVSARSVTADQPWMTGVIPTAAGEVPQASNELSSADRLGSWKARWGFRRMRYPVSPGLYAIGQPTPDAPVLVSANYKMSFDRLRSQLGGLDAWILVLDTKGINVWCAAGKGTFGTDEMASRVEASRLREIVSHRRLVVPQLGAPGVNGLEVKRRTGFRVVFGPVRAEDLPAFLAADMKATPEMRRVRFPIADRAVLIPIELVGGLKYALWIALGLMILAGIGPGIYSFDRVTTVGVFSGLVFLAAFLVSVALTPLLLPWLPGRRFSVKGACLGVMLVLTLWACGAMTSSLVKSDVAAVAWGVMIPTLSSFVAMNFTGASTYTSLSGVQREMRVAVPLQIVGAVIGVGLWLVGRFV